MKEKTAKELLDSVLPQVIFKTIKPKRYKEKRRSKDTEERRQKDRERILKHKPWEKTKGAITPEGKKKVSMNAYKHGRYSKTMKEIDKIVGEIKKELKQDA